VVSRGLGDVYKRQPLFVQFVKAAHQHAVPFIKNSK
jgi:hypothetical protein